MQHPSKTAWGRGSLRCSIPPRLHGDEAEVKHPSESPHGYEAKQHAIDTFPPRARMGTRPRCSMPRTPSLRDPAWGRGQGAACYGHLPYESPHGDEAKNTFPPRARIVTRPRCSMPRTPSLREHAWDRGQSAASHGHLPSESLHGDEAKVQHATNTFPPRARIVMRPRCSMPRTPSLREHAWDRGQGAASHGHLPSESPHGDEAKVQHPMDTFPPRARMGMRLRCSMPRTPSLREPAWGRG